MFIGDVFLLISAYRCCLISHLYNCWLKWTLSTSLPSCPSYIYFEIFWCLCVWCKMLPDLNVLNSWMCFELLIVYVVPLLLLLYSRWGKIVVLLHLSMEVWSLNPLGLHTDFFFFFFGRPQNIFIRSVHLNCSYD